MNSQQFDRQQNLATHLVTCMLTALCLVAGSVAAEETPADKKLRTVIKATMHVDVSEVEGVLELLDVKFAVKPDQNLIVIRGHGSELDNALKVIDALDSPRPSIDLRVFVLAASKGSSSTNVPKELEAAVSHLAGVFGFRGFELLDNVLLSVLEGRKGRVDGGILLGDDQERTAYQFGFQSVTVVPEENQPLNIRIKGLKFEVNGEVAGTVRASLMTDVQIREGQKAVIGSSTPQGVGETLILVVQATASADPASNS